MLSIKDRLTRRSVPQRITIMSKSLAERFRVAPGKAFKLASVDPREAAPFDDKDKTKAQTEKDAEAIDGLQDRLFAEGKRALLVVLQGIDCSGKDGTVRAVFNTSGPIGVTVNPFKAPTAPELAQDYLWRVHKVAPPRGMIGIFNRSHYEDVLVVKVKGFASPETVERRYAQINAFEKMLTDNGTRILQVHAAHLEGRAGARLQERVEDPKPSAGSSIPATSMTAPSGTSTPTPTR
jgi:polyphosphate kinase 2 (PPK2 family)